MGARLIIIGKNNELGRHPMATACGYPVARLPGPQPITHAVFHSSAQLGSRRDVSRQHVQKEAHGELTSLTTKRSSGGVQPSDLDTAYWIEAAVIAVIGLAVVAMMNVLLP